MSVNVQPMTGTKVSYNSKFLAFVGNPTQVSRLVAMETCSLHLLARCPEISLTLK